MSRFAGKVALVTGAGAGIGRALAQGLAARGARLVLADRDAEAVRSVAAGLPEAEAVALDVTDAPAAEAAVGAAVARWGVLHQLWNVAGTMVGQDTFLRTAPADFDRILAVNLGGVVTMTRAALPALIASGDGDLVNVSSLSGIMAQGGMSAYCASKFAVRGFTETLRIEMLAAGAPVRVCVVHPGGVRTGFIRAALPEERAASAEVQARHAERTRIYDEKLMRLTPEEAARQMLAGVERGRARIMVGAQAAWLDRAMRLMPELGPRLVARWQVRTFGW